MGPGCNSLANGEPMPVLLQLVSQIPAKRTAIMLWQESDGPGGVGGVSRGKVGKR